MAALESTVSMPPPVVPARSMTLSVVSLVEPVRRSVPVFELLPSWMVPQEPR